MSIIIAHMPNIHILTIFTLKYTIYMESAQILRVSLMHIYKANTPN